MIRSQMKSQNEVYALPLALSSYKLFYYIRGDDYNVIRLLI